MGVVRLLWPDQRARERWSRAESPHSPPAGKTIGGGNGLLRSEKHPHVRGEDAVANARSYAHKETPPRAWGRQSAKAQFFQTVRNTPTCVGKTPVMHPTYLFCQKHPHVRGEDDFSAPEVAEPGETPPRAWGRPLYRHAEGHKRGNTPTCVGKTLPRFAAFSARRKHPHVRGEDLII